MLTLKCRVRLDGRPRPPQNMTPNMPPGMRTSTSTSAGASAQRTTTMTQPTTASFQLPAQAMTDTVQAQAGAQAKPLPSRCPDCSRRRWTARSHGQNAG